jgi:glyoxylase-like metal-dependent hydrolase (beta-lactamase superfamily II)
LPHVRACLLHLRAAPPAPKRCDSRGRQQRPSPSLRLRLTRPERGAYHNFRGGCRMRITFWGVRGSIPTPGRDTAEIGGNTSCVEVRAGKLVLVLDGGTGLRLLGQKLLKELPLTAHIFFSHVHWDHIQGFPFLRLRSSRATRFICTAGTTCRARSKRRSRGRWIIRASPSTSRKWVRR